MMCTAALGDDGDDSSVREYYNITAVPAILLFNVGYKDPSTRIIVDAQTAGFLLQSPKTLYTQASNFLPSLTKRVTQYSLGNFFTDVRADSVPISSPHYVHS
jgi:hypothetical protein